MLELKRSPTTPKNISLFYVFTSTYGDFFESLCDVVGLY